MIRGMAPEVDDRKRRLRAAFGRALAVLSLAAMAAFGAGCAEAEESSQGSQEPELAEGASRLELPGNAGQGSNGQGSNGQGTSPSQLDLPDQPGDQGPGGINAIYEPDPIPWHMPVPNAHGNDA